MLLSSEDPEAACSELSLTSASQSATGALDIPTRSCPTPRSVYSPPEVDRIWVWEYYNEGPIYPIFYLLKGDYTTKDECYLGN